MAENNENKKQNGVLAIFTKEYKYEGLILLTLSLIAIVLGVMVLIGVGTDGTSGLTVNPEVWLIGKYPAAFAWILVILGVVSMLLALWPYYKPSLYELRRVAWPTKGTMLQNSLTVFAFIIVMALFFLLSDIILGYVVDLFELLATKLPL